MRFVYLAAVCVLTTAVGGFSIAMGSSVEGAAPHRDRGVAKPATAKAGTVKIWEDRGELNPKRVYFGASSAASDPLARLPAPPFGQFEPDDKDKMATSPKAFVTDSKKVKWTAKFGEEVHSDTIAPRLAWALGYGTVEGYFVGSGKFEGVNEKTDLGREKGAILPDGTFPGGARFKRHDPDFQPLKDEHEKDIIWDEAHNPGVPPEQLSGLLIFDVVINNWDAQPKNCKVYRLKAAAGPEDWYIVSDLGASFSGVPKRKFQLDSFKKAPSIIKRVTPETVEFAYSGPIGSQVRIHQQIPLTHAKWFRAQLAKLTDEELQAAFDAGFATDALNHAYAAGDPAGIKTSREHELSVDKRAEIAGFVAALRARIEEFKTKVPADKPSS